jgi:Beta-glucanase/Beta-glucan synthetase
MKSINRIILIVSISYFGLGIIILTQILQAYLPSYSVNGKWTLVWEDDFKGLALDQSKWMAGEQSFDYSRYIKNQLPYSSNMMSVQNGNLIIPCSDMFGENLGDPYYMTRFILGQISTREKYAWKYGRFEIRAKLPKGAGILSDISLRTTDGNLPQEIRMMTISGQDSNAVLMNNSWGTNLLNQYLLEDNIIGNFSDSSANFHTFAIEWEPKSISWYVDNIKMGQTDQNIPKTPIFITLGTTASNLYLTYLTSKSIGKINILPELPQSFIVDWVRVYQRK